VPVHAGVEAFLHVVGEGVCGHGDYGHGFGIRPVQPADGPGRLIAVHYRHADIHEDSVVIAHGRRFKSFCPCLSFIRDLNGHAVFRQQGFGDFLVQRVILTKQYVAAVQTLAVPGGDVRCQRPLFVKVGLLDAGRNYCHSEAAAPVLFALHADSAAHGVHCLLHDGKTQPSAAHFGVIVAVFLHERFKKMFLKLPAHADPVIAYGQCEADHAVFKKLLMKIQGDRSALRCVFYRVGEQIEIYAVEPRDIYKRRVPRYWRRAERERLMLFFALRPYHGVNIGAEFSERIRLRMQDYFLGFGL